MTDSTKAYGRTVDAYLENRQQVAGSSQNTSQYPPTVIARVAAVSSMPRCSAARWRTRMPADPMTAANAVMAATVPTPNAAM